MGWQTVRDQYELLAAWPKPQGGKKCQGEGDGWMHGWRDWKAHELGKWCYREGWDDLNV